MTSALLVFSHLTIKVVLELELYCLVFDLRTVFKCQILNSIVWFSIYTEYSNLETNLEFYRVAFFSTSGMALQETCFESSPKQCKKPQTLSPKQASKQEPDFHPVFPTTNP